ADRDNQVMLRTFVCAMLHLAGIEAPPWQALCTHASSRSSIASQTQKIHQAGKGAGAESEETEREVGEAIENAAKDERRDRRENLKRESQTNVEVKPRKAIHSK